MKRWFNYLAVWAVALWPRRPAPNAAIERLEGRLLSLPQVPMPLTHRFAPGVYLREIFMPAGTFVIGHEHKTEHFNVVLSGRARVLIEGAVVEIKGPAVFVSKPGVRKVLMILEDMRWATVHPTTETDLARLESELIIKSPLYLSAREHQLLSQP